MRKLTKVSKWTPLSRRQLRIDLYNGFEIKLDVIDNFGQILDDRLVTLSDRKRARRQHIMGTFMILNRFISQKKYPYVEG